VWPKDHVVLVRPFVAVWIMIEIQGSQDVAIPMPKFFEKNFGRNYLEGGRWDN